MKYLIILVCILIYIFYINNQCECKELFQNIKNKFIRLTEDFEQIDIDALKEKYMKELTITKEKAEELRKKEAIQEEMYVALMKAQEIDQESYTSSGNQLNYEKDQINEDYLRIEEESVLLDDRDLSKPNMIPEDEITVEVKDGEPIEIPLFQENKNDEKIVFPEKAPLVDAESLERLLSKKDDLMFPSNEHRDAYVDYRERQLALQKIKKDKVLSLEKEIKNKIIPKISVIPESEVILNKIQSIPSIVKVKDFSPGINSAPLLTVLPVLNNESSIELLAKCHVPIKLDLVNNNNFIINSGQRIYQDILQTESQKAYLYNKRYNLMQVSWYKSSMKWYGDNIALENRFTFVNSADGGRVHIIFPLILIDLPIVEKFVDTYFDKGLNKFESEYNHTPYKFGDLKKGIINPISENIPYSKNKKIEDKAKIKAKNISKNIILQEKIKDKILDELDKNAMVKNIQKDTAKLTNQMNDGIMRPVTETLYFKSNNVHSSNKEYHEPNLVRASLSSINHNKIDVKTIPSNVNLDDLSNKLSNSNFNSIMNQIKNVKYSISDIKNLLNLNTLLINTNIIPEYICCSPVKGELINFNFFKIQDKILAQEIFYYSSEPDSSLLLFTQPQPFNKQIGNAILSNLTK